MPINFPPLPAFPYDIDDDSTLYKVYNTTETTITADNPAWSEEIQIKPRQIDEAEIWADNGFATISGELFYYDSVERDGNDKINKLKGCVRNLGGSQTKYNKINTDIRSFVIAEHQNQLALAIIEIEKFIGTLECDNEDNLVCCLEELDIPNCTDDGVCPDLSFDFEVVDSDSCNGTLIAYTIDLRGSFTNFQVDFGDGTSTNTPQSGEKLYPPGVPIDPIATVSNEFCEIIVTGVQRTEDTEPQPDLQDIPLSFPVPTIDIPDLNVPSITTPTIDITIPPIITPCIDLEPINIDIGPISIGDINVPSEISLIIPDFGPISLIIPDFGPISLIIPDFGPISLIGAELSPISLIMPDFGPISLIGSLPETISIIGQTIPEIISIVGPTIPDVISIIGPNLSPISLIVPEFAPISLIVPELSPISLIVPDINPINLMIEGISLTPISLITTSLTPISLIATALTPISLIATALTPISLIVPSIAALSVNWAGAPTLSCVVTVACPSVTPMAMAPMNFDDEAILGGVSVDYDVVGIPESITIEPPDIPNIQIEHNIPRSIQLIAPYIPDTVRMIGMYDLPSEISIIAPSITPIKIDATSIPEAIKIDWGDVPQSIRFEMPDFPSVISFEHNIKVDMPGTITLEVPEFIPLKIENPFVDLVYRGDPLEVKIKLDIDELLTDGEGSDQCFTFVRCKPK